MFNVLEMKGFPPEYIDWVMSTLTDGHVAIMVNDIIGPYFKTRKGLRQGDPLSPILFNIAADSLAVLVKRAQDKGLIKGLASNLVEDGLIILQYADDTIFCFEDDLESARNLKFILCIFEHLTGLKINFHKSEVYCLGDSVERQDAYSSIFTCQEGTLPFKYLGIPIKDKRLNNKDWKAI